MILFQGTSDRLEVFVFVIVLWIFDLASLKFKKSERPCLGVNRDKTDVVSARVGLTFALRGRVAPAKQAVSPCPWAVFIGTEMVKKQPENNINNICIYK